MPAPEIDNPRTRVGVRNDLFDPKAGLDRGRPFVLEALWHVVKCLFFLTPWPVPSAFKRAWLRGFGARIGKGVVLKPRINILFPWKLVVGEFAWIGEEACILNFEPVTIGAHCCVSQRAFLCTGNHDFREPHMPYRNRPIVLEPGAWVGACCFVGPGVVIGAEAVVTAGSVVTRSLPSGMICSGNPCSGVRPRCTEP